MKPHGPDRAVAQIAVDDRESHMTEHGSSAYRPADHSRTISNARAGTCQCSKTSLLGSIYGVNSWHFILLEWVFSCYYRRMNFLILDIIMSYDCSECVIEFNKFDH
jgi:hypothetical protein